MPDIRTKRRKVRSIAGGWVLSGEQNSCSWR